MALIDTYEFPEFGGISIQTSRSMATAETFVLNVRECLQHIRRLPSGDILLNQIKLSRPLGVSPAKSDSAETRALRFGISTMVVIIPMDVEYMQSGYMRFGGVMPSTNPQHNPDAPFYRRGSGASTEALDHEYSQRLGAGSKAVIKFSNALMSSGLNTPPFIILAHELIHAQHYLFGVRLTREEEESRTTGIGKYDRHMKPMVTENQLRREAGLPLRVAYDRVG